MTNDLARLSTEPAYASWPIDCTELDDIANRCPMSLAATDHEAESLPAERRTARAAPANRAPEAIVFIDSGVSDVSAIVKAASLEGEVVMLDSDADGLEQIACHLAGRPGTKRISLLAPGCTEGVRLGSASLTSQSLSTLYRAAIESIRASVGEDVEMVCVSGRSSAPCQSCVLALLANAIGGRLVAP
ncbi:MAG: DUF4347 domain-containing protein [Hyphomicrobiaceae bacterium]